jgi:hypothetical protein
MAKDHLSSLLRVQTSIRFLVATQLSLGQRQKAEILFSSMISKLGSSLYLSELGIFLSSAQKLTQFNTLARSLFSVLALETSGSKKTVISMRTTGAIMA